KLWRIGERTGDGVVVVAEFVQPIFIAKANLELSLLAPIIANIEQNLRAGEDFADGFCIAGEGRAKGIVTLGRHVDKEALERESIIVANRKRKGPSGFDLKMGVVLGGAIAEPIMVPLMRGQGRDIEEADGHVEVDFRTHDQQALLGAERIVLGVE